MAIPKRGLADIRTHSGLVDQTKRPHKAYLKLSCLEMEKIRRGKEKASATHRVENIDERLKKIQVEEAALLQRLEDAKSREATDPPGSPPKQESGDNSHGFKLKY